MPPATNPSGVLSSPPVSVEEFLAQGRLQRADIVLCRGSSLFSRLIRWATRSRFSHAALVFVIPDEEIGFEHSFLIEAVPSGVDITDVRHYAVDLSKKYDVAIKRFEAPWFGAGPDGEKIRRLVRGCMLDFIKAEYDFGTVLGIARSVLHRIVFGLNVRFRGMEPTLKRTYAKKGLAPAQFICSGFVQWGYYDAVRRLSARGRLPSGRVAEVLFSERLQPEEGGEPKVAALLSITPEDLAASDRLAWKWVIVDEKVHAVASAEEAYALIDRQR